MGFVISCSEKGGNKKVEIPSTLRTWVLTSMLLKPMTEKQVLGRASLVCLDEAKVCPPDASISMYQVLLGQTGGTVQLHLDLEIL